MQLIEDFMHELFKARADVERTRLNAYQSFRERFLVEGYHAFSPHEFTHAREAERITSVTHSNSKAVVTTSTVFGAITPEYRYHLVAGADRWAVAQVEIRCMVCRGTGRRKDARPCRRCNETGWQTLAG